MVVIWSTSPSPLMLMLMLMKATQSSYPTSICNCQGPQFGIMTLRFASLTDWLRRTDILQKESQSCPEPALQPRKLRWLGFQILGKRGKTCNAPNLRESFQGFQPRRQLPLLICFGDASNSMKCTPSESNFLWSEHHVVSPSRATPLWRPVLSTAR